MTRRKTNRTLGGGIATLVALVLGSTALPASQGGDRRPPADAGALRRIQLASMNAELAGLGGGDWPYLASRFADDPGEAGNARLVFVALSLANVEFNRYQLSSSTDTEARTRSLERLERVVAQEAAWTGRSGSGGAAVYLVFSVLRLSRECDVGDDRERIDALLDEADRILTTEADARMQAGGSFGLYPEDLADSAAVLAAASVLLPASDQTEAWESAGRSFARRSLAGCASPETLLFGSEGALSYLIAGKAVPTEFLRVPALSPSSGHCRSRVSWSAAEAAAGGGPTDKATESILEGGRGVAGMLLEHFLWINPPGSICAGDPSPDN